MKIWVYVSCKSDHVGLKIEHANLADNANEVKLLTQRLDCGNEIWRSWCLANDGELISAQGDSIVIRIGAEHLNDLPKLREQYAGAVGSDISVGVGQRLSE